MFGSRTFCISVGSAGGRFPGRPRKRCGGLRTDPGAGPRGTPLRVVESRRTPHSLICRPHRPPAATRRPASWLSPEPLQERFSSFPPTRGSSRAPIYARARGSSRPNKANEGSNRSLSMSPIDPQRFPAYQNWFNRRKPRSPNENFAKVLDLGPYGL